MERGKYFFVMYSKPIQPQKVKEQRECKNTPTTRRMPTYFENFKITSVRFFFINKVKTLNQDLRETFINQLPFHCFSLFESTMSDGLVRT